MSARAVAVIRPAANIIARLVFLCILSGQGGQLHAYKDGHARNSSWPGELISTYKAEYICADLSTRPRFFPCSRAADHT